MHRQAAFLNVALELLLQKCRPRSEGVPCESPGSFRDASTSAHRLLRRKRVTSAAGAIVIAEKSSRHCAAILWYLCEIQ